MPDTKVKNALGCRTAGHARRPYSVFTHIWEAVAVSARWRAELGPEHAVGVRMRFPHRLWRGLGPRGNLRVRITLHKPLQELALARGYPLQYRRNVVGGARRAMGVDPMLLCVRRELVPLVEAALLLLPTVCFSVCQK